MKVSNEVDTLDELIRVLQAIRAKHPHVPFRIDIATPIPDEFRNPGGPELDFRDIRAVFTGNGFAGPYVQIETGRPQ